MDDDFDSFSRALGEDVEPIPQDVNPPPNRVSRLAHEITVAKNVHEVQVLTVEKYQWYSIEVSKVFSMHENRQWVDWIFESGVPFVIRPVRIEGDDAKDIIIEKPTVKTGSETRRWFIPWRHNVMLPSFITYSPLPFSHDGTIYRFIDIDFEEDKEQDQIHLYCDYDEFKADYHKICEHNLTARKMDRGSVNHVRGLMQGAAKAIVDTLGVDNFAGMPLYTGGGFRLILRGEDPASMKTLVERWASEGLVCTSSTMGYQPQKLFSVQTLKEHFQTEVDPFSRYFKFSNPAFFFTRYNDDILERLFEYYKSYTKEHYKTDILTDSMRSDAEWYTMMREKQVRLEKELIPLIERAS